MNQYERITGLEIALTLRDQRSRRRSILTVLSGSFFFTLGVTFIHGLTVFQL